MSNKTISVFLFFLTASLNIFSQSVHDQICVRLEMEESYQLRGKYLYYLEDKNSAKSIEQVVHLGAFFKPSPAKVLSLGYTTSAIWLRVMVSNDNPDTIWKITIDNPNIDSIAVYDYNSIATLTLGCSKNNNPNINYEFAAGTGAHTYYIRVVSHDPLHIPIQIAKTDFIDKKNRTMDIWQGIYVGIIMALALYNFCIYASIRKKAYLFYSIYTICIGLTLLYNCGYLKLVTTGYPFLNKMSIFSSIGGIFAVLFVSHFLNLHNSHKHKLVLNSYIFLFSTSLIAEATGYSLLSNLIMEIGAITFSPYLIFVSISSWKKGYPPAKSFLFAWAIFLIGVFVYCLSDFGVLPHNIITRFSPQFGNAMESILLSFALGNRISYLIKQKQIAEENERKYLNKYNELVGSQNDTLQKMVITRTKELEKSNKIKNKFFSIIAHDLRSPLSSLKSFTAFLTNHTTNISESEIRSLSKDLHAKVENTIELTDNLLRWASIEMNDAPRIPQKIGISQSVKSVLKQLNDAASAKRIELIEVTVNSHKVFADPDEVQFIIRNLVSNAIKFTNIGGTIIISTEQVGDQVMTSVADTGVGLSAVSLASIFNFQTARISTYGTNGEKGTGLGLLLCKEFVERNNGTLTVNSKLNSGSTFTFSLPSSEINISDNPKLINAILDDSETKSKTML